VVAAGLKEIRLDEARSFHLPFLSSGAKRSLTPAVGFWYGQPGDYRLAGQTLLKNWQHNVFDVTLSIKLNWSTTSALGEIENDSVRSSSAATTRTRFISASQDGRNRHSLRFNDRLTPETHQEMRSIVCR
jgi:hypothetical protein